MEMKKMNIPVNEKNDSDSDNESQCDCMFSRMLNELEKNENMVSRINSVSSGSESFVTIYDDDSDFVEPAPNPTLSSSSTSTKWVFRAVLFFLIGCVIFFMGAAAGFSLEKCKFFFFVIFFHLFLCCFFSLSM